MNTNKLFEQLIASENLSATQTREFMRACMGGELNDVQIAVFLSLMRMKGETIDELTAAASVMLELAHPIVLGDDLIDIVGTGGDGKNTFNVSTISSFVASAAGAKVAKHGNRSVSSHSGSADLLLQAGFELQLNDEQLKACMEQCGVSFLFAPHFHQAMQHARQARQQLGIRSFFNLLGPLVNPARVKKQVVGVYAKHLQEPVVQVLANLGSHHALVINSQDGMDEISISAITDVVEYKEGQYISWSINPRDYNCFHPSIDPIVVSSPAESLMLAESVFNGQTGPARDIVLLNTAAALYCADEQLDFSEAVEKAKTAIDSGEAKQRFMQLKELTQTFKTIKS